MKKQMLLILLLCYWLPLLTYISSYLPPEPFFIPERLDEPGYAAHTRAHQYMFAGYDRKSRAFLEEAAQKGYIPAYRKLGDIYYHKLNQPKRGVEYYTIAAENGDKLAIKRLADIYVRENNFQKAAEYYEKLTLKKPEDWKTLSAIYRQLGQQKKADDAQKKFEEYREYYYQHR